MIQRMLAGCCALLFFLSQSLTASATESIKEQNIAQNQAMTVQSNQVENWPTGPTVSARSAILIEADTGAILYAKNIHQKEYPASTTKILTTLITSEECALDELVSFSKDAVFDIDRGSNHIAIDVGEKLTIEECLNAILIRSANEVSLAVAEHISGGDWEDFAPIMNARAKELGCLNSNFVNPNGLPNEEHYTTAYDMAMIGKAFFANEALCKITLTPMLRINASAYQPDDIVEVNQMELIPTGKYAYQYLVGCKTGYTNDARSALVACAEKDGMKLISVVLRDEAPLHYEDTIALFEYGFNNFEKINISKTETKYNIDNTSSFYSDNDIFGNSEPILALNQDACIILPKTTSFEDLTSTISYDTPNEYQAALITYTYQDVFLGCVSVDLTTPQAETYSFEETVPQEDTQGETAEQKQENVVFINILKVLGWGVVIVAVILAALFARLLLKNHLTFPLEFRLPWRSHSTRSKKRRRPRHRRRPKRPNRFRDYDF